MAGLFSKPKPPPPPLPLRPAPLPPVPSLPPIKTEGLDREASLRFAKRRKGFRRTILTGSLEPTREMAPKKTLLGGRRENG